MKVEKSCVTFLLCSLCWYVHKPDAQNSWDDNTHTQRLGGRAVTSLLLLFFLILLLFCASRSSDSVANNKVVYYFHVKYIRNFAPDGHGTKFSCVGGGVRV